jgi:phosphoenolpyruvate carboxykinase (ATP)
VVLDETTKDKVWWGEVNIPIEAEVYELLEDIGVSYLNSRERLFIVDGYGGHDEEHRMKFRIICNRAYHALFMRNMLVMPTPQQLVDDFDQGVDFHIMNAGELPCPSSPLLKGTNPASRCNVSVNLKDKKMIILGT